LKRELSYKDKEIDTIFRCWIELSRIQIKVRSKESLYFESHGLTMHQFGILEILFHRGKQSVGTVTKLMLSSAGNITVVIKNLEKKGFLEIEKNPNDKREKILSITDSGSKLISKIFPKHIENMRETFSGVSKEEMQVLAILLRKLDKSIK